MQPTTNGYSRRALLILAALKSKGFMAAYGSRLLTAEMMQNLTRAEGYLMITAAAEGLPLACSASYTSHLLRLRSLWKNLR